MADLKISQLSAATALAGTEVVPVVQSGSTKKATIDQILAPASGKGIDFSAAGGDTLTMYDEGTWTPGLVPGTSGSISLSVATGRYTRVGNVVNVIATVVCNGVTAPVGELRLTGLPFAVGGNGGGGFAPFAYGLAATAITSLVGNPSAGNTYAVISKYATGTVSDMAQDVQNGTGMYISLMYLV